MQASRTGLQPTFLHLLFPKVETPSESWFDDAFPRVPYQSSPPGAHQLLILLGYDISNPKRLQRVAKTCEDFGLRVQYSLFECHLEEPEFERLWSLLLDLIDEDQDRLVAYRLDSKSARRTVTAGTMVCAEKVICYLV